MSEQRKIRVAVVFGGRSAEHAVSCASAGLVLGAIDRDRYEVVPVGIARDGRWVLTSGDPARLALGSGELPSVDAVATPGVSVTPRTGSGSGALVITGPAEIPAGLGDVDVVLPLLHGTYGEDGTIQGLLEMTGIRYAGAGVLASAAGMDKEYMKLLFTARGLPIGRYVVVRERDWGPDAPAAERKRVLDEIAELGWPVFVKPARGGSSIGTSRVTRLDDLEAAIEDARRYDRKVLVEAAVDGAEVECAVLEGIDGGAPEASVPGQIVVDPHSAFYDFEAKYLGAESRMDIPAPIPAAAAGTDPPARVRGVRRDLLRGAGARRLLLHHGRGSPHQRDQHHAGHDPVVGFPADVGGERPADARADRPHHPDGAAQVRAGALAAGPRTAARSGTRAQRHERRTAATGDLPAPYRRP